MQGCDPMSQRLNYEYTPNSSTENPYLIYEKMRTHGPIHWNAKYHSWFVTGYQVAQTLFKDSRLSSATASAFVHGTFPTKNRDKIKPIIDLISSWIIFADPPYHTQLRKVIGGYFSNTIINELKPKIYHFVNALIPHFPSEIELMAEIARPLPALVISELLGLPKHDVSLFQRWNENLARFLNSVYLTPDIYDPALAVVLEEEKYFVNFIQQLIARNESGFIHDLHRALAQDSFFDVQHLWMLLSMLLGTGSETTTNLIGNTLLALLQNPAQLELLKQYPDKISDALEESLRFYPPVQSVMRQAQADFEIETAAIKKGQYIRIFLGAINRDPEIFDHPHQFDIARDGAKNLSFGFGIHYCLGNVLARVTATICVQELIKRYPSLHLKSAELQWIPGAMLRGLEHLPIIL